MTSILLLCLSCIVACHQQTQEEVVRQTLKEALEALDREDYDAYLQHVDLDMELDSVQKDYMRDVLRQHMGWRQARRARLASIDVIELHQLSDSIYTAYCQYTFADSTKEVLWQKMVRQNGQWKLRLRN